jgi:hypothetical protein
VNYNARALIAGLQLGCRRTPEWRKQEVGTPLLAHEGHLTVPGPIALGPLLVNPHAGGGSRMQKAKAALASHESDAELGDFPAGRAAYGRALEGHNQPSNQGRMISAPGRSLPRSARSSAARRVVLTRCSRTTGGRSPRADVTGDCGRRELNSSPTWRNRQRRARGQSLNTRAAARTKRVGASWPA